jgi:hypothetical protein
MLNTFISTQTPQTFWTRSFGASLKEKHRVNFLRTLTTVVQMSTLKNTFIFYCCQVQGQIKVNGYVDTVNQVIRSALALIFATSSKRS